MKKMVMAAKSAISEHGDSEWFVSDDLYIGPKIEDNSPPWDE